MRDVRVQQGSVCVLEQLESRIHLDGTDFSPGKPESFGNQLVHFTAQLSQKRSNINAAALGTKVFFPGGFVGYSKVYPYGQIPTNRIDIYDTATREWSKAKLSVARGVVAAVTVGNRVLFAGGLAMDSASQPVASDRVDIYDATTRTWSTARLSQGRYAMSAVVVGDIAIFAGGNCGTSNAPLASDVVDLYDARTGRWTTAKLSSPRMYMGATAAGTKAFFAEGYPLGADGVPITNVVDVYDTATAQWSTRALSEWRKRPGALTVGDVALFVRGATQGQIFELPTGSWDAYNARTGQWSSGTISSHYAGVSARAGNLGICLGSNFMDQPNDTIDLFDAVTGTWSTAKVAEGTDPASAAAIGSMVIIQGNPASIVYDTKTGNSWTVHFRSTYISTPSPRHRRPFSIPAPIQGRPILS